MIGKFLIRILLFSLPVLAALLVLEMIQRHIPNDYTHKKQLFESQLSEWQTLVLGSSHTYLAIIPDSLEGKTFNLSATAQTLYFDHFLFEKYIDRMTSLETVILPISYPSLGAESDRNPGDFNRSYHYRLFYGSRAFTNPLSIKSYSIVNLFTIKKSVDRTLAYYTKGDSLVEFRRNGWFATDEQKDLEKNGKDVGPYHDQFYFEELIPVNTDRISTIIQKCKDRGINIILISPPMYKTYLENTRPERYQKMVAVMDSLSQAHEVPYFNFTEDNHFEAADFFDSNHLRTQGARKFSPLLREKMGEVMAGTSPDMTGNPQ